MTSMSRRRDCAPVIDTYRCMSFDRRVSLIHESVPLWAWKSEEKDKRLKFVAFIPGTSYAWTVDATRHASPVHRDRIA